LKRAARDGQLRPGLGPESASALVLATLSALALPQMRDGRRGDLALAELERWLGVSSRRGNQSTD
jgi:hypothetical protein